MALRFAPLFLLAVLAAPVDESWADEPPVAADPAPYVRVAETEDEIALEIAVRDLAREDGKKVRLVGVIHVADAPYYDAVQEVLDASPLVLYESVMPPGVGRMRTGTPQERVADTRTRLEFLASMAETVRLLGHDVPADLPTLLAVVKTIDPHLAHFLFRARLDAWDRPIGYLRTDDGGPGYRFTSLGADGEPGGEGPAADLSAGGDEGSSALQLQSGAGYSLQKDLADVLDLAWQGEGIDYARDGWRPSDMAIDELRRAAEARGGDLEDIENLMAGAGLRGLAARLILGGIRIFGFLFGDGVKVAFKVMMITMLGEPTDGPDPGSGFDEATWGAVVEDRDAVVVADLEHLLEERPDLETVAIFYGAGHMRDLERRLAALGFRPQETRWLRAMAVDLANSPISRERIETIRRWIEKQRNR